MKSNSKETNRIKEPSKFAIKFANIVFMLGILFSVYFVVYAVYKMYYHHLIISSPFKYPSLLLFAILTSILLGLGLSKLSDKLKVNMSVLFFTVGVLVCGFETYLVFFYEDPQSLKAKAEKMGIPFDTRTAMEVLVDLRDSGSNVYPSVSPRQFINSNGLKTVKGKIYPLGDISNITTIFSNESGYYPIIETDEHGFNNPKGLYKKNRVDIVLTGDSMTEGWSVHSDETISAVIRESGFNTISIGKSGNGSLIELSSLKEYAEPLKPRIVLWFYNEGDLIDLNRELKSSLLSRYLNEDDYSQNLISKQEEIDDLFKKLLETVIYNDWGSIIRLRHLRQRLNIKPLRFGETPPPSDWDTQQEMFNKILQQAEKMVSMWDGKMYFVYLPGFNQYSKGIEHSMREFVLRTATELDIPIIDILSEVFDPHPDPLSLFPFRNQGHYTADGYRLVGEAISKKLKADGITPLNSKN